ncbi:conserved hypothetical protein [Paecilomyces variotii No. 5]|uniref:YAG7-like dimerisation domain-containing protein n=1 Tax=Byssochlamys spectabilis (strain No. 5 / NBRC 109023) TaxID=1356009 RepID=V5FC81_BYSSN|nr:conserved hypothetical protein [Paecilomyces variotii No. 5]
MSAVTITNNPPAPGEPKGAKKKRAKSSGSNNVSTAAPASIPDAPSTPTESVNGAGDSFESAVMRDLQKSLRNAVKKLNATSKVDSIIAENPGKSLDELIASKKINQDQKAQALKKPALQANVAQLEEQIAQYKQFAAHYEERLANQKSSLEKTHKEELDEVREKVLAEAAESNKKGFRDQLLVLSKFLRAAAAMRRAGDETSPESRAFEGVLFQVYGGTDEAVDSMLKLIEGAEEKITSVEGDALEVSYGKVKQASEEYAPVEGAWTEEAPAAETTAASDPTLANAGATELQDSSVAVQSVNSNGFADPGASQPEQASAVPPQTIAEDGANAQAHSWDPQASDALAASTNADGWVEVPRDPTETDTGIQNTPAAAHGSNNWAEDVPKKNAAPVKAEGDGFEPVVHHQRQPSQRGRGRGRGRGDGFRGRGGRGEFRGRGRGRGEFRGGRGRGGFGGQQNSNGSAAPVAAQ